MVVVTGTSGSGKTVLVHVIVGFIKPTTGEVLVGGNHVESLTERQLLSLLSSTVGLVFQEDALFSGLSTYDNAAFRLVEHARPPDRVEEAVQEILTFVGLEDDADKLPEELSIGMRRRLEIARALIGWPKLMLFDEPTSGLDPLNARRILDLLIRARDVHGITSVVVTKEMYEIPYLANHVADERGGRRDSRRAIERGATGGIGSSSRRDGSRSPDRRTTSSPRGSGRDRNDDRSCF